MYIYIYIYTHTRIHTHTPHTHTHTHHTHTHLLINFWVRGQLKVELRKAQMVTSPQGSAFKMGPKNQNRVSGSDTVQLWSLSRLPYGELSKLGTLFGYPK